MLAGEPPSPINPPTGCPFHPRCPLAQARCREDRPLLRPLTSQHLVACHLEEIVGLVALLSLLLLACGTAAPPALGPTSTSTGVQLLTAIQLTAVAASQALEQSTVVIALHSETEEEPVGSRGRLAHASTR
jgi:hypothetical protein